MRIALHVAAIAAALSLIPAPAGAEELTLREGRSAPAATLIRPVPFAETILIVPGHNAPDAESGALAALATALGERGFGSLRIDRPAKIAEWSAKTRLATGSHCVWLLGHGKGGRAALSLAASTHGLCGVILVATPAHGSRGSLSLDRNGDLPLLIVSAGRDPQAGFTDGTALRAANPGSTHTMILAMDQSLREDTATGVSPGLVDAITAFLFEKGPQIQETSYRKKAQSRSRRSAGLDSPFGKRQRAKS